jgi:glycosyltransferase involved in cell wall biosynthesis
MMTTQKATLVDGVSVIIPAYNEEGAIATQIAAIDAVLAAAAWPFEIIVVDDGSADNTLTHALETGARVLKHPENRGYGASLKTGIRAATYNVIVISDADGTYPPDQIPVLVAGLDSADMVVGARIGGDVNIPLVRRPAKAILRHLAAYITGSTIPDLNSGLRAFYRDCIMQYFPILSDRFSFTTTSTMSLLADDYVVKYIPINYYRRTGRSKIRPLHFMDFTVLILRMSMMFQPLKVFVPLAFIFGGLGVVKVIYDVITLFFRADTFSWSLLYQPAISTSAIFLLLIGLQLLLIGMMADGLVRRMAQHNRAPIPSRGLWEITDHLPFRPNTTDDQGNTL